MSRNSRWLLELCMVDQYDECVQRNRKMDKTDGDSYVKEQQVAARAAHDGPVRE